jgi:hypothetical protein
MTDDERRIEIEGWRTAIAVKLAILDRRDHDISVILRSLDADVLRVAIAELAISYFDAIRFSGVKVTRMHSAVQRDALAQASD